MIATKTIDEDDDDDDDKISNKPILKVMLMMTVINETDV